MNLVSTEKKVLGIRMIQKQIGHQSDGVITARHLDPGVIVRGERALQPAAEFELVALLADGGPLGPVAGTVEIGDVDRRGLDRVAESHILLPGVHLVDGKLGRSGGRRGERRQKQKQRMEFHKTGDDGISTANL